jgi:hypothetical protein
MCGHTEAVQVLLSHGANPSLCNRLAETPLHKAVSSSLALTQLLLKTARLQMHSRKMEILLCMLLPLREMFRPLVPSVLQSQGRHQELLVKS